MAKTKKDPNSIMIELTTKQLTAVDKLFQLVKKHPAKGAIIGQILNSGLLRVGFFTPEDLQSAAQKMILERDTIIPAKGS